jgi:S1-C subfamily serine protease
MHRQFLLQEKGISVSSVTIDQPFIQFNEDTGDLKIRIIKRVVATAWQLHYNGKQYTMTNNHVCKLAIDKKLEVGGKLIKILRISELHDICLLQPIKSLPALRLANSLYSFEPVYVIGHPRGLAKTIRQGWFTSTEEARFPWLENPFESSFHQLDIVAYPGNSGSPVLDFKGDVIGLLFGGFIGFHTETFIVPLEDLRFFLRGL